jgi:Gnt-I system high-affinity gluconate transporter
MVLATGAGSVMFSHFNDTGFWMFKEYFNLSIKQTFMTWTVMECTIGIVGITTVLIMNIFM